jgi:hypothetical protein
MSQLDHGNENILVPSSKIVDGHEVKTYPICMFVGMRDGTLPSAEYQEILSSVNNQRGGSEAQAGITGQPIAYVSEQDPMYLIVDCSETFELLANKLKNRYPDVVLVRSNPTELKPL